MPRAGFGDDLKNFNLSSLKKTKTVVTNPDGTRVVEEKDEGGTFHSKPSSDDTAYGFVVDVALDLQVGEVLDGLIIGSQDVAHDLETLQKYKVTHIVNLAYGVNNLFPEDIQYLKLEWRDLPDFPAIHGFERAIKFIEDAQSLGGCALVHCNAGVSRAAAVCMAYLIKNKEMTVNEAFTYLRAKRPAVCPNPGFVAQLNTFYEKLYPGRSKGPTDKSDHFFSAVGYDPLP